MLEQAYNWIGRNRAHYVSVATPSYINDSNLPGRICKQFGIGVLFVKYNEVREIVKPKLYRRAKGFKLYEEQKTFCEAGGNQGGHWTPFKQTVRELICLVKKSPGIEFNQVVKSMNHHYSTFSAAKSCLRGFIGTSVIPELKIKMIGRKLCVYPADFVITEHKMSVILSGTDKVVTAHGQKQIVSNIDNSSFSALNV